MRDIEILLPEFEIEDLVEVQAVSKAPISQEEGQDLSILPVNASLNRAVYWINKTDCANITAWRSGKTSEPLTMRITGSCKKLYVPWVMGSSNFKDSMPRLAKMSARKIVFWCSIRTTIRTFMKTCTSSRRNSIKTVSCIRLLKKMSPILSAPTKTLSGIMASV